MITWLARNPQAPESPSYLRLIGRFFKRPGFLQSIEGENGQKNEKRIKNIFKGKDSLCPHHKYPPSLFLEIKTTPHGPILTGLLLLHTLQVWDGHSGATQIHSSCWPPLGGQQADKWPQKLSCEYMEGFSLVKNTNHFGKTALPISEGRRELPSQIIYKPIFILKSSCAINYYAINLVA